MSVSKVLGFSILFILSIVTLSFAIAEDYVKNILTPHIVGAITAKPRQFPYHVYLISNVFPDSITITCGGSLISIEFVLTAAHCIYVNKIEKLDNGTLWQHDFKFQWVWDAEIILGAHYRSKPNELNQRRIYIPANNFIIHREYRPLEHRNDIALIRLPEKVQLNEWIKTINLPHRSMVSLVDRTVLHAGWGIMNSDTRERPFELRYAYFKVIDQESCNQKLINQTVEKFHVCALGKNGFKQMCSGDSGGALAIEEDDGSKTQVGLASTGFTCDKNYPSVFTRVSNYLDWISEHTGIIIHD